MLSELCCVPSLSLRIKSRFSPTASLSGRAAIAKIYGSDDFKVARVGPIQWEPNGDAYTLLQPEPQDPDVFDVVECTIASGSRRVLVNGSKLSPPGSGEPFPIEAYSFSKDKKRFLIFTNSKPVWRENTRGDYWVLDTSSERLQKLGGDAPPSTLMFAKFSRRMGIE